MSLHKKPSDARHGDAGTSKCQHAYPTSQMVLRPVTIILGSLSNVRQSGESYRADCPNGHSNARGSLSIAEAADGRVLMHCFSCLNTPEILSKLGLQISDLFDRPIRDASIQVRQAARQAYKRSAWKSALQILSFEAGVVLIAADQLTHRQALSEADEKRLLLACERIDEARRVLT